VKIDKISVKTVLAACLVFGIGNVQAGSLKVDYGVVTGVEPIDMAKVGDDKSKLAMGGGGLLGGVIGYTFGKGSTAGKKRRGIILGTATGALLGKEATKGAGKAYNYKVELNSGDSVSISTEQGRIDVGDCVSVERGDSANIRRVSQTHCSDKEMEASEEQISDAKECMAAKSAIAEAAETDEALDAAVENARKKCED
jgi:outer membrane lipoprotein SlyB